MNEHERAESFLTIDQKDEETWHDQQDKDKDKGTTNWKKNKDKDKDQYKNKGIKSDVVM